MKRKIISIFGYFISVFLLFACSACNSTYEEKVEQTITIQPIYAALTLGNIAERAETILYGEVIEKSETTLPEFINPNSSDVEVISYCRKVTVRVIEGLKGCKDGDIIYFWEHGGIVDGVEYIHEGVTPVYPGDKIFVALEPRKYSYAEHTLVENDQKKANVPFYDMEESKNYKHGNGTTEMPMQQYLQKVKKVLKEQAKDK